MIGRRARADQYWLRKQHELILEHAGEGIYGIDLEGRTTFANPAALRMVGYSLAELLGKELHPLIHHTYPDGRPYPSEDCGIARALRQGNLGPVADEVFWRKDGSSFPVEYMSRPILTREGRICGAVVVFSDISARKKTEAELSLYRERLEKMVETRTALLAESSASYRSLFDDSSVPVWVEDFSAVKAYLEGLRKAGQSDLRAFFDAHEEAVVECAALVRVVDMNAASLRLFGVEGGQPPSLPRHFTKESTPVFKEELLAFAEGRTSFEGEIPSFDLAGVERHLILRLSVIRGFEKDLSRVHVSFIDISERRRAEKALDRERQLLRTFLDSLPDQIYVKDPEGRIILANPGALRAFGRAEEAEVIGKREAELLPPALAGRAPGEEVWLAENSGLLRDEVRVENPGEAPSWYSVTKAPIAGPAGEYLGLIVVNRDISLEKEAEESLRRSTLAAEAANKAKSDFLANMSHEIRTPLNAIIGFAQLLQRHPDERKKRDYVYRIQTSAQLLLDLVTDILDVSKIEEGKLQLETIPFDTRDLFDTVLTALAPKAAEKGLQLRLEIPEAFPARLVGDPLRLAQVLLNLGGNALKFTREGEIVIDAAREGEGQGLYHFGVRDSGIGMSAEERQRLFLPFSQADSSITRRFGGTGLGLAICRHLVGLMGGRIWVESETGKGSHFHFTAFFGSAEEAPAPAARPRAWAEAQDRPLAGSRLLLVEDNEVNLLVAREMLELAGAAVDSAGSGEEALAAAAASRYDAILMDVQMPGMSGYEATRRLRKDPQNGELPVIAFTANVRLQDRTAAEEAGMNDYIAKPIKYSELLDVLARWLPAAGRGAELPSATEDGGPAESGPADSGKEGRREAEERSPAQDVEEAGEVATDVAVGVAAGQEVPRPLFDGIDMEEGLGRALGREALQLSLLGSFARTQAGTPGRLAAAIAAGDLKEAVMAVHTARGAAGNIAALDLHRAATELETALREGAGLGATAQVEVFLRELARVLAALAPLGEGSA